MSIFEEVSLSWGGAEYVVPADKVMGLIEVIEEHITLEELNSKGLKRAHISKAYAAALVYAGARGATQEKVYNMFFNASNSVDITNIITALLMLIIPPEHLQEKTPPKPKASRKPRKKRASA